jgi:hypothetical protein
MAAKKIKAFRAANLPADVQLSGAAQDLMFRKPNFIVRWGLLIVLLVMLTVMIATWFIRYPELLVRRTKIVEVVRGKEKLQKYSDTIIYRATVLLAVEDYSKLSLSQPIYISFDDYPLSEYGYVTGKVNPADNLETDNYILTSISFPDGLRTNQNKIIPYHNGLQAEVRMALKDVRLFKKILTLLKQK